MGILLQTKRRQHYSNIHPNSPRGFSMANFLDYYTINIIYSSKSTFTKSTSTTINLIYFLLLSLRRSRWPTLSTFPSGEKLKCVDETHETIRNGSLRSEMKLMASQKAKLRLLYSPEREVGLGNSKKLLREKLISYCIYIIAGFHQEHWPKNIANISYSSRNQSFSVGNLKEPQESDISLSYYHKRGRYYTHTRIRYERTFKNIIFKRLMLSWQFTKLTISMLSFNIMHIQAAKIRHGIKLCTLFCFLSAPPQGCTPSPQNIYHSYPTVENYTLQQYSTKNG